jgi:hypothetical protein
VQTINPRTHLCCYGLYAPVNEAYLRGLGVQTILGGEFEAGLVSLYRRLASGEGHQTGGEPALAVGQPEPAISLARQDFITPDRASLPDLRAYAWVQMPDGSRRVSGYTETSRGCKHRCRHCPIVPVYNGQFRIVQREVVLDDIRRQVAAGAWHITFGDPDFFNGPGHAVPLVQALHAEFPDLTYDVTIKVEHLLKHADLLPVLRDTGCLFVTSAVEAVDDGILGIFDKRHTRADFVCVARHFRAIGLAFNPTFVTFTPRTTLAGYADLLATIADLDLVDHVSPVQYAIRLLIPAGSRLLELAEVRALIGPFDSAALCYPWHHPDPAVDQLYSDVLGAIKTSQRQRTSRQAIFASVWRLAAAAARPARPVDAPAVALSGAPIPHMSEPWYC